MAVAACGSGAQTFRGRITAVDGTGIIEWSSVTVRDEQGKDLTFLRGDTVDLRYWRASHLREHLQSGEPVTVRYSREDRGLVALEITD